jgi:hypothetical protein
VCAGRKCLFSLASLLAALLGARNGRAQSTTPETFPEGRFQPYLFYLGALETSALLYADEVCPEGTGLCPIGGGGGLVLGVGRRYRRGREWVVTGDVSVRNARNLLQSATLTQLRTEHRWVLASPRTNLEPYVSLGGGVLWYGERFGATTAGLVLGATGGVGLYLSPFFRVDTSARFDALRFLPFRTDDGILRGAGGVATLLFTWFVGVTVLGR